MNCEVVITARGWRCPRCGFEEKKRKAVLPIYRRCRAAATPEKRAAPKPAALVVGPCIHRSAEPLRKEACLPCARKGKGSLVDVYACSLTIPAKRRQQEICTIDVGKEVAKAFPCEFCRYREEPIGISELS